MASKQQQSGMRGVYLVAAELVARGFIVSVTSRGAAGADLLVTTDTCARASSVQVKATIKPIVRTHAKYWLLNHEAKHLRARSHVYVFISIRNEGSEFYVVPSRVVARNVKVVRRPKSTWYSFDRQERYRDAWHLLRLQFNTVLSKKTGVAFSGAPAAPLYEGSTQHCVESLTAPARRVRGRQTV